MAANFSTETVEARERVESWRQLLRDRLKVDCSIETDDPVAFRQAMAIRQCGSLSIMDMEATPFRATRRTREDDCLTTVIIPQTGSGTLKTSNSEVGFGVGELCAFHSCRLVSLAFHDAGRHLIVTVPSVFLMDRCPEWDCDTLLTLSAAEGAGGMFTDLVRSIALHEKHLPQSCREGALSLVLALLASAARTRQEPHGHAATQLNVYHKERIRNFALAHLRDPGLDIAGIAAGVGLSARYIHHLFSDEPLHLMQWVYEQRLLHCHRELADRDSAARAISEIAYAWGFNTPAHFCRVFQKRFGATPSEIRAQAKSIPASTFEQ